MTSSYLIRFFKKVVYYVDPSKAVVLYCSYFLCYVSRIVIMLNGHLFGKELFIRLLITVRVFRGRWPIFVCVLLSLLVLRVGCGM